MRITCRNLPSFSAWIHVFSFHQVQSTHVVIVRVRCLPLFDWTWMQMHRTLCPEEGCAEVEKYSVVYRFNNRAYPLRCDQGDNYLPPSQTFMVYVESIIAQRWLSRRPNIPKKIILCILNDWASSPQTPDWEGYNPPDMTRIDNTKRLLVEISEWGMNAVMMPSVVLCYSWSWWVGHEPTPFVSHHCLMQS